jgi:hypothetical protein
VHCTAWGWLVVWAKCAHTPLMTLSSERQSLPIASSRGRAWAVGCSLILAGLVALAHPIAEIGINDDTSYVYSADVVARTGHIVYNGWAAMPLTWQLYWGALFIKLFGFSFFAARLSNLVIALATVLLMHRTLQRSGLGLGASTFGTCVMMLSPVYFLSSAVFMTDMTGFFAIMCCFYCLTRAVQAGSESRALVWLLVAAFGNVAFGSVRQIAWLGVLVAVPCAVWLFRGSKRVVAVMAAAWILCAAMIGVILHWFSRQPYAIHEPVLPASSLRLSVFNGLLPATLTAVFFLAPLFVVFAFAAPRLRPRYRIITGLCSLAAFFPLWHTLSQHVSGPLTRWVMPFTQNTLLETGFYSIYNTLPGDKPVFLTPAVRSVFTLITYLMLIAFVAYAVRRRTQAHTVVHAKNSLSVRTLATVYVPFCMAYLVLYLTRVPRFDRYLVPLCFCATLFLLRWVTDAAIPLKLSIVGLPLALMATLDVVALHDLFAFSRAQVQAANELVSAGIPRTHIGAAGVYNQWTEIELTGHIKYKEYELPGSSKLAQELSSLPCPQFFEKDTPSVKGEYIIVSSLTPCYIRSHFADVPYTTWSPAGTGHVIIAEPQHHSDSDATQSAHEDAVSLVTQQTSKQPR